jgi:hypothetical protein
MVGDYMSKTILIGLVLGLIFGAGGVWMLASNNLIQLNVLPEEEPCQEIINVINDCPEEPEPKPPMIADYWDVPMVESDVYTYNTTAPLFQSTRNLAINLTVNGTCYLQNLTIRLYTSATSQTLRLYLKSACLLSNNQVIPPPLSYPYEYYITKTMITGDNTYTFTNLNYVLNCSKTFQNTFYLQFSSNTGTIYPYFILDSPEHNLHDLYRWTSNVQYNDWAYDLALNMSFSKVYHSP